MRLLTVLLALTAGCAFGHGARPPADVKLYSAQPDDSYCIPKEPWCEGKAGFVRKQDKELKPFDKGVQGWLLLSPSDLQLLVQHCPAP